MDNIIKEIKNKNGTIDVVMANSNDNYDVKISNNYKLVKFSHSRKSFKDSILGTDIGVHSSGFTTIALISTLLAIGMMALMYLSFRI